MVTITGVIATALLLLAGPYRYLQQRWPLLSRPLLPDWVHANLATAALVAILVHSALRLHKLSLNLEWLAVVFYLVSFGTGIYGLYMAAERARRRRWLRFHGWWSFVVYAAIALHVVTESVGPEGVLLVLGVWLFWRYRSAANARLLRLTWPFHKGRRGARTAGS